MKKSDIQMQIEAANARLRQACEGLSETEAAQIGVTETWSVKDAVSHITFWHGQGAGFVKGFLDGTWKPSRFSPEQVAEINENMRGAQANLTFEQAQAEFAETTAKVRELLATLPDEIDENETLGKIVLRTFVAHPAQHAAKIEEFRTKQVRSER